MRRLSIWALIGAWTIFLVWGASNAHASDYHHPPTGGGGDYQKVEQKTEPWVNKFSVNVPYSTYMQLFKITVKLDYYRWVDNGTPKVAPFGIVACWATQNHQGPPTGGFQGLKTNTTYTDSAEVKGPYSLYVPSKDKTGHCEARYIPIKDRVWMLVSEIPAWMVNGSFAYSMAHDPQYHLHWKHNGKVYPLRPIQPDKDPTISTVTIDVTPGNIGGT